MSSASSAEAPLPPAPALRGGLGDRLRRMLGGSGREDPPRPVSASGAARGDDGADRWAAMDRVRAFLMANGLDPTPDHYALGWRMIIDGDLTLGRAVAQAQAEGAFDPETAARLLSEVRGEIPADLIEGLIGEARLQVATVAGIVGQSRDDAQAYGDALESRTEGLAQAGVPGSLLSQFVDLTRTLIGRSRDAEDRLRDMDGQMAQLRTSLDEASRAADSDPLTGLANRRAFERQLARAVADAEVDRSPLTLAFCDIDHFKHINDTHGHDVGDRILRFVADLLNGEANEDTIVARYGGEEFVMLFEHVPFETALATVDRLRLELGARRLVARDTGTPVGMVTFSAGLAPRDGDEDGIALLRAADRALYRAKEMGRDRVFSARDLID